jgi:hypothetical protein
LIPDFVIALGEISGILMQL